MRLAFGCESGVGKDTAVDHLISKYGGVKLSFASAIYDLLYQTQDALGLPREKDRAYLQFIGAWARSKKDSIWIDVVRKKIADYSTETNIFVTDVRHQIEFEMLSCLGFGLIRITRPFENRKNFGNGDLRHASEVELLRSDVQWHYNVANDSTLEEFLKKIEDAAKGIALWQRLCAERKSLNTRLCQLQDDDL